MPKTTSIVIIIVIILTGLGYGAYWYFYQQKPVACIQEAKQCPGGSYVSRIPPKCEFAPCPVATSGDGDYCTSTNDCTARFSRCDCRFHCVNKTVEIKDCSNQCNIFPEAPVCKCINNKCVDAAMFYLEGTEKIKNVFVSYLLAEEKCDIELASSLITEKSKEIIHYTCSNMKAELKCLKGRDYSIYPKADTAIVHFSDFSKKTGWPFFFAKENGEWKIDFYKMAFGIVMGGGGCDTGWGWKNKETRDEFCSYFEEGKCPAK